MFLLDASVEWQFKFQDPASPIMEGIIDFHHDIMFALLFISFFVLYMLCYSVFSFSNTPVETKVVLFSHNTLLEVVWTVVPSLLLIIIAAPSFALLYSIDELISPALTFKGIGHQWYWVYEYTDHAVSHGTALSLDSYMLAGEELFPGGHRLLEVTARAVFPINMHIRALFTSTDVLHSWAVPSLGVKVDACPGRLNQAALFLKRLGLFYGQCSEICGVNHGYMPVVVQGVSLSNYFSWLSSNLNHS